jgi:hypothetical protein
MGNRSFALGSFALGALAGSSSGGVMEVLLCVFPMMIVFIVNSIDLRMKFIC